MVECEIYNPWEGRAISRRSVFLFLFLVLNRFILDVLCYVTAINNSCKKQWEPVSSSVWTILLQPLASQPPFRGTKVLDLLT